MSLHHAWHMMDAQSCKQHVLLSFCFFQCMKIAYFLPLSSPSDIQHVSFLSYLYDNKGISKEIQIYNQYLRGILKSLRETKALVIWSWGLSEQIQNAKPK